MSCPLTRLLSALRGPLLFVFGLAALPAAAQTVQVLAVDPDAAAALFAGDAVYVRLGYAASEPVRFRAHAYHGGERQTAGRTNPAPLYPAGEGEALVWIEYAEPADVDSLDIVMLDEGWRPIDRVEIPVSFEWRAGGRPGSPRARASWASRLSAEQQRMTGSALQSGSDSGSVFLLLLTLGAWSIPGYFVMQIIVYRRWEGRWRTAGLLPLMLTAPILLYTVFALLQQSNLWPLVMIFTYPPAFLYLVALAVGRRLTA